MSDNHIIKSMRNQSWRNYNKNLKLLRNIILFTLITFLIYNLS